MSGSLPSTGNDWIDFVITAVGFFGIGSIVSKLIEWLRDSRLRARETYIEISKLKIDKISSFTPYYLQLSWHCSGISTEIGRYLDSSDSAASLLDSRLCMYYIFNILKMRVEIIKIGGDIQLDSIEAESLVNELFSNIIRELDKKLTFYDRSRMTDLIERDMPYYKFYEKVSDKQNADLISEFEACLADSYTLRVIQQSTKCLGEVIVLEMNYLYRLWYNQEPSANRLTKPVLQYIKSQASIKNSHSYYEDYYNRLLLLGLGKRQRLIKKIRLALKKTK